MLCKQCTVVPHLWWCFQAFSLMVLLMLWQFKFPSTCIAEKMRCTPPASAIIMGASANAKQLCNWYQWLKTAKHTHTHNFLTLCKLFLVLCWTSPYWFVVPTHTSFLWVVVCGSLNVQQPYFTLGNLGSKHIELMPPCLLGQNTEF